MKKIRIILVMASILCFLGIEAMMAQQYKVGLKRILYGGGDIYHSDRYGYHRAADFRDAFLPRYSYGREGGDECGRKRTPLCSG